MTYHCPACAIAAELRKHRDQSAPTWDVRRATLNFALVVAETHCPDYVPEPSDPAPDTPTAGTPPTAVFTRAREALRRKP